MGDIRETLKVLVEGGAHVQQELKDVGRGNLIARVKAPDGNLIGLRQPST